MTRNLARRSRLWIAAILSLLALPVVATSASAADGCDGMPESRSRGIVCAGEFLAGGARVPSQSGNVVLSVDWYTGRVRLDRDGSTIRELHYDYTVAAWEVLNPNTVTAVMQEDGNFVVYGTVFSWADYSTRTIVAADSHTWGHPGAFVKVQDDGKLVVYGPDLRPLSRTCSADLYRWCRL